MIKYPLDIQIHILQEKLHYKVHVSNTDLYKISQMM